MGETNGDSIHLNIHSSSPDKATDCVNVWSGEMLTNSYYTKKHCTFCIQEERKLNAGTFKDFSEQKCENARKCMTSSTLASWLVYNVSVFQQERRNLSIPDSQSFGRLKPLCEIAVGMSAQPLQISV